MPTLQGLYVSLQLDSRGYREGLKQAQRDLDQTEAKTKTLDTSTKRLGSTFGSMVKSLAMVSAATMGASYGILRIAESAAKTERARMAFSNLARSLGEDPEMMFAGMQRASQGMLSMGETMQASSRLMSMGLANTSAEAERLTRMAITLGLAMGTGPQQAFEDFTLLLANQSILRLDTFGISGARVRQRIEELQAATKGLSREQAFMAAVLEEGEKAMARLGKQTGGADVAFAQLRAKVADLRDDIGSLLIPVIVGELLPRMADIVQSVQDVIAAWETMPPALKKQAEMIAVVLGALALSFKVFGLNAAKYILLPYAAAILAHRAFVELAGVLDPLSRTTEQYQRAQRPLAEQIMETLEGVSAAVGLTFGALTDSNEALKVFRANISGIGEARAKLEAYGPAPFPFWGDPGEIQETARATDELSDAVQRMLDTYRNVSPQWAAQIEQISDREQIQGMIEDKERLIATVQKWLMLFPEESEQYKEHTRTLQQLEHEVEFLEFHLRSLGTAEVMAGAAAVDMAADMGQMISALVAAHPVVLALQSSIAGLQAQLEGQQAAQRGLQSAISAASRAMRDQSRTVQELNEQLSEAKQRLSDLTRVRITGMGALEEEQERIQDYINALRLEELTQGRIRAVPIPGLPRNIEELQRMLEILRLRQEVEFGPRMRELRRLAEGERVEMPYEAAKRAILEAQATIERLEGRVDSATRALESQQRGLEGLQDANQALSEAIQATNEQIRQQEASLTDVEEALTGAYTWFLKDRDEIIKLGPAAAKTALLVDEKMRLVLGQFGIYTESLKTSIPLALADIIQEYRDAAAEILRIWARVPGINVDVYRAAVAGIEAGGVPAAHQGGEVIRGGLVNVKPGEVIASGKGGGDTHHWHIQGSVITERELTTMVRENLLRLKTQNLGVGLA